MVSLKLPGGLILDGEVHCNYAFKPVSGWLERTVAESGRGIHSLAAQVTNILSHTLDHIGGRPATQDLVKALSSGDRAYLILQLKAALNPEPQWLTRKCQGCGERVQFQVQADQIPIKPAGEHFPRASVTLSIGRAEVRVPIGRDEEKIAQNAHDHESAMEILIGRLVSQAGYGVANDALSREDQRLIDQVLDEMSPQAGDSVSMTCPYCDLNQEMSIDNYAWIVDQGRGLDQEVHTLALHYHWSEKEILALPKKRRRTYIRLIEQSIGLYSGPDHLNNRWRQVQ